MKQAGRRYFLEALAEQIERHRLAALGERWLVAVSGGADSMALLHGLARLQREGRLKVLALHVAHLDHGLRGAASESDAALVGAAAARLGLAATTGAADVAGAARASGESIETEARRQRYRFLAETAARQGCGVAALGHTAEDQAETILHRIVRGTGIRGLAGMAAARRQRGTGGAGELWVVRPMLEARREEVEAFLRGEGIEWREDASNRSAEHTRNRIRHELLPLLAREYNPQVAEALLRLGRTAGWLREWLGEEAEAALAELTTGRGEGEVRLDAARLRERPRMQQAEVVRAALAALGAPERRVGRGHVEAVLAVAAGQGGEPPRAVQLPYGVRVRRKRGELIIEREGGRG